MLYKLAANTTIVVVIVNIIVIAMVTVTSCCALLLGYPYSNATTNVCVYWYLVVSLFKQIKIDTEQTFLLRLSGMV